MANEKLELVCEAIVVVGASATNKIALTVTCQETVDNLNATLSIPCGVKDGAKTYLLGSTSEEIDVKGSPGFDRQSDIDDSQVWKARDFTLDPSKSLTVQLSQFSASQGDGEAAVTLQIRKKSDELLNKECPIRITLPKKEDKPSIHYFAADRISRVYSDTVPIEFSSYTTLARRLKLKNLTTGKEWTDPDWAINTDYKVHDQVMYVDEPYECLEAHTATRDNLKDNCPGVGANWSKYWKHLEMDRAHKFYLVPEKTSTYRLEAWLDKVIPDDMQLAKHDESKTVEITVEQQGETSVVFQKQGYPLSILTGDLKGGPKRLYGVFLQDKEADRSATLWSMASPMGWWAAEASLPRGMEESPGVITDDGQLWLIGGSSTNPMGPRSNHVRCYRKNSKNELAWEDHPPEPPFPPRMGHACVVFKNKIWVLGGLDEDNQPLNDVWSCTVNQAEKADGTLVPPTWKRVSEHAAWPPRCMFAACVKPVSETYFRPNESFWICGGTRHPYRGDVAADFWYSGDGEHWDDVTNDLKFPKTEKFPEGRDLKAALGAPLGATLLYENAQLILAGVFRGDQGIAASRHSFPFSEGDPEWTKQSSKLEVEKNRSDPFVIRSVIFNNIQLFLPVYQKLGAAPADHKLYVSIP